MEVIELPGYTPEEKLQIAMKHLIPRVLLQHGLSSVFIEIPEVLNFLKLIQKQSKFLLIQWKC
jgi:ATP-dependent Lon protease